jgi:hypothetical protein
MLKFTPPFIYVDCDAFFDEEAKYNHEIEQEMLESEWLREWLSAKAE